MSECSNLMDELNKCLINKQTIDIKQIYIQQKFDLFDDLDTSYRNIKINIFELNNKLFNCKNDSIIKYLHINKLKISSEDHPHMYESHYNLNNITIQKYSENNNL